MHATLPEMIILMLTLFNEGSVCSEVEMRAIARVIQVGAEDRKTSVRAECLRPYRYSSWNGYRRKHVILRDYRAGKYHASPVWKLTNRVALDMYSKQMNGLPRWNHFYNPSLCTPAWACKLKNTKVIGHHVFGRID